MTFANLIDNVRETNSHTRFIFLEEEQKFQPSSFFPSMTPSCFLSEAIKEENRRVWQVAIKIFEKEYGSLRFKRISSRLFLDENVLIKTGMRSLMNHDVRRMILATRELYSQDLTDIFRALKAYHHYPEEAAARVGFLPEGLLETLSKTFGKEAFKKELDQADSVEKLATTTWNMLHQKIRKEKPFLRYLKWEDSDERLATATRSFFSRLTYDVGLPFFGIQGLQEADARERLHLINKVNPNDTDEYSYFLSKGMAYRELYPGYLIPASRDESGFPGYYEVYQKIVTDQGMVAYALKRASPWMRHLQPIILFRGTSTAIAGLNSLESMLTDVEPVLGQNAYLSGREKLQKLFEDRAFLKRSDKEIKVIGHSLGGSFVQFLAADLASEKITCSAIHISYFIANAPASSQETVALFAKSVKGFGRLSFKGTIFKAEDDPANDIGEKFIGIDCPLGSRSSTKYLYAQTSSKDPHCDLLLLKDPKYAKQLDNLSQITDPRILNKVLDNTQNPMHRFMEFFRRFIARPIIYLFIWPIHQLFLLLFGRRVVEERIPLSYSAPFTKWWEFSK